jgi:hypothetical protein
MSTIGTVEAGEKTLLKPTTSWWSAILANEKSRLSTMYRISPFNISVEKINRVSVSLGGEEDVAVGFVIRQTILCSTRRKCKGCTFDDFPPVPKTLTIGKDEFSDAMACVEGTGENCGKEEIIIVSGEVSVMQEGDKMRCAQR